MASAEYGSRPFVFVGRFVDKKNLIALIEAYARYREIAEGVPRRLVLVGSGPEGEAISARIASLGLGADIDLPGFLSAPETACALAQALALVLPSREEQWGLVVNEALAFALPVIVSEAVGSRDALVRNLINGFVIEPGSREGIAHAMLALAEDEALWQRMSQASAKRAPLGDTARLADAVAHILDPRDEEAAAAVSLFAQQLEFSR